MKKIFLFVMLLQSIVAYAHPSTINQLSSQPDSCPVGLRDRVSLSVKTFFAQHKLPIAVVSALFTGIKIGQFGAIYHAQAQSDNISLGAGNFKAYFVTPLVQWLHKRDQNSLIQRFI